MDALLGSKTVLYKQRAVHDVQRGGSSCVVRSIWETRVGFTEEASLDSGLGGA